MWECIGMPYFQTNKRVQSHVSSVQNRTNGTAPGFRKGWTTGAARRTQLCCDAQAVALLWNPRHRCL
jgi:hypothetical protein